MKVQKIGRVANCYMLNNFTPNTIRVYFESNIDSFLIGGYKCYSNLETHL